MLNFNYTQSKMKRIYSNVLMMIGLVGCLSLNSCKKLSDININPNQAASTHPQAQLTKVQWDAFRAWKGTAPLYAIKMILQTDGENVNQIYSWQRGDFSQYGLLRNVLKMQEEAENLGADSYTALAKFFNAYYFYNLTLTFGDIPYSESLKGESEGVFAPKYDTQKEVFQGILKNLREASELLAKNPDVIAGDIIYQGNSALWVKAINAFRLKVLLTLSHKVNDSDLNIKEEFASIVSSQPLFTSISEDAQLVFLNQEGNRYPQFNESSYGSAMYMDSTFIKRLQDRLDPRLFVFAGQTRLGKEAAAPLDDFSFYEGGDPAVPYAEVNAKAVAGKASKVLERYSEDPTNEPLILIGYAEQQLMIAEAILRGWISGDVNQAYEQGVRSSFKFYEVYAKGLSAFVSEDKVSDYLEQPLVRLDAVSSTEEKIERIMMQKYLRSFHQGGYSAYYDHLRTGYPEFRKAQGVRIAYRWMYPQDEYNVNSDHVSEAISRQFAGSGDNTHTKTWWLQ